MVIYTSPLCRLPGWEQRLADFVADRRDVSFRWGIADCATTAIDWVEVLTGVRVWTVTWQHARAAAEAIAQAGGLPLAATAALGPATINWMMVRRGDVALARLSDRDTLTVCTGRTLCGPGPTGLDHVPITDAELVWRIG